LSSEQPEGGSSLASGGNGNSNSNPDPIPPTVVSAAILPTVASTLGRTAITDSDAISDRDNSLEDSLRETTTILPRGRLEDRMKLLNQSRETAHLNNKYSAGIKILQNQQTFSLDDQSILDLGLTEQQIDVLIEKFMANPLEYREHDH
jgi:hypothetical protein